MGLDARDCTLQVALPYLKAKLEALYSRHRRLTERSLVQRLGRRQPAPDEGQRQVLAPLCHINWW